MSRPEVYKSNAGERYVVFTGKQGELQLGRLIDVPAGSVGPDVPVASIAAWLPYEDFTPFDGAPPPALAGLMKKAGITDAPGS